MMNQLDSIYLDFVLNEPSLAESERLMSWIDSIEQSQSQSQSLNRIHVDLGEILLFPMSLRLLMDTSVVSAVKILSRHTDPSISSMSKQILSRWRALVEHVLRVCA